jgi:hypothetical protein
LEGAPIPPLPPPHAQPSLNLRPSQDKKDVTISYSLLAAAAGTKPQFEDTVEYRARPAPASSPPSRIVGVDTLHSTSPDAPTCFKWRGRGLLLLITSSWQLLGLHGATPAAPAWAVTYFEKTLFTPTGIDIYARTAAGLPEALVRDIVRGLEAQGGAVAALAAGLFEVPRSGGGA